MISSTTNLDEMSVDLDFFITTMPESRPADYYIGCLDGCIFMVFDNCNAHICLVRISFDGYGCCELGDKSIPMDEADSITFKEMMETQEIDQSRLTTLVTKTILNNRNLICEDALNEYALI